MSVKFTFGLLIGAALGAAVVHFLNTEEGKAFTSKLKRDAAKVEDDFVTMAEDLIEKGEDIADSLGSYVGPEAV